MEMDRHSCVSLEAVCPTLARSRAVKTLLKKAIGEPYVAAALAMMKAGRLDGELGKDLHDLLSDAIANDSKQVWSRVIHRPHDDYPVSVNEFHGVFWVDALEFDPVGYFLDKKSAVSHARSTWLLD